ncbi:MAG: hypothetical protein E7578_01865 [Ruminococcaceae bacterium]|nr:hypothetical protein [Oscillospiraceae bacterium]
MNQIKARSVRNPSLDVLRITAFFLVVSVHFFALSDYKKMAVGGPMMLLMSMAYSVAVCCVPLFIMLTGYLQTNKTLSKKYYLGITRPAATYILASVACLVFKIIKYSYPADIFSNARRILDFTASDYAWYMEMYFGLFLMIPFLNAAYHGMKDHGKKLILVVTFLVLTALPGILNTFNFVTEGWWSMPSVDRTYNKLIPGWWTTVYPITYYFIGCYLREFPLKLKKLMNLLLLVLAAALFGAYYFYRLRGGEFFYGAFITDGSLTVAVVAVLLFSFIAERDMRCLPSPLRKILEVVSGWTLAAYLVSQIFDVLFYPEFKELFPVMSDRIKAAPLVIFPVFFASLLLGGVIDGIYRLGEIGVKALVKLCRKR